MKRAKDTSEQPGRKPYKAPKLVELGTVRDLTASGGKSIQDNVVLMTKAPFAG